MGDTVMNQAIQRMIGDAREAARKKGVGELADSCKKIYEEYPPSQGDVEIRKVLSLLDTSFLRSSQPPSRRGGVAAVAAVACTIPRQLSHEPRLFSAVTSILLPFFKDVDPQVRLLAVEGMMNVLAHLKKFALDSCFSSLFSCMLIAAADRDQKIQHACAELSNVVKEVSAENPKSFVMPEFVMFVKTGLQNTASTEAINFVHQWITISQSIPVPNQMLVHYLGEFLKPLFHLVNQHGVAARTEKILQAFMVCLKKEHRAGNLPLLSHEEQLLPSVVEVEEGRGVSGEDATKPPTLLSVNADEEGSGTAAERKEGAAGATSTPTDGGGKPPASPSAAPVGAATLSSRGNFNMVLLMEIALEAYNTTGKPRTREISSSWTKELLYMGQGTMFPIAHDILRELIRGISDTQNHAVVETTRKTLDEFAELLQKLQTLEHRQEQDHLHLRMETSPPGNDGVIEEGGAVGNSPPSPMDGVEGGGDETKTPMSITLATPPPGIHHVNQQNQQLQSQHQSQLHIQVQEKSFLGASAASLVLPSVQTSPPQQHLYLGFHGVLNDIDWPAMVSVLVDSLNGPQPSRLELLQWAVLINLLRPAIVADRFDELFPALMSMLDDPDSQVLHRTIEVLSIIAGEEKFPTFIRELLDSLEASKELLSKANIIFKRLQSIYSAHAPPPGVSSGHALALAKAQQRRRERDEKDVGGGSAMPTPMPTPTDIGHSCPPTPVSALSLSRNRGDRGSANSLNNNNSSKRGSGNHGAGQSCTIAACVALETDQCEKVFLQTALLLEEHPNKQFAATLVVTLTAMLLTAHEFTPLRELLKLGVEREDARRSRDAFVGLYPSWCYNPVSAIALCLLTKTYDHAYTLVVEVGSKESSIHTLVQLDRLVQLLEAPVFAFVRLALLQPRQNASLVQCLFGIQMILPQGSPQFKLLQQRLVAVTAVVNLGPNAEKGLAGGLGGSIGDTPPSPPPGAVGGVASAATTGSAVDWGLMGEQFKIKQLEMTHHEYTRRTEAALLGGRTS